MWLRKTGNGWLSSHGLAKTASPDGLGVGASAFLSSQPGARSQGGRMWPPTYPLGVTATLTEWLASASRRNGADHVRTAVHEEAAPRATNGVLRAT